MLKGTHKQKENQDFERENTSRTFNGISLTQLVVVVVVVVIIPPLPRD